MLDDEDRHQPVSAQDVADALMFVLLECGRAFGGADVNAKLEDMASQLLESGGGLARSNARTIVLATAQNLIETETSTLGH